MTPTLSVLLWALPWLAAGVAAPFWFRVRPRIDAHPAPDGPDAPLVSVIVPARNEAENIGTCLSSLLASGYRPFEIIVVDDGSTDGTGHIARQLAASAPGRLRVLEGAPLPEGWLGKCWACWQGYRAAEGQVLLFTDADTRHGERLLGHAVGSLLHARADVVSVVPQQLMLTFWERIVLPHIFTILAMRYPDMQRLNRSRNPRDVIANGQYLMIGRAAYERIGGHEAVRDEVVEDLRLAQRVVASGGRLHLAHAEDHLQVRMYRSLAGIVEGWSKNLAIGARQSVGPLLRPVLPWLLGVGTFAFWVTPAAALLGALAGALLPGLGAWGLTATLGALLFWTFMYRYFRIPLPWALSFPLGGAVAGLLFLRSAVRGRRVEWKGRTYRVRSPGSGGPSRESRS